MMEKCYEYFACTKTKCCMYNNSDDRHCWEVEGTLCNSFEINTLQTALGKAKFNKCTYCIYRKAAEHKINLLNNLNKNAARYDASKN